MGSYKGVVAFDFMMRCIWSDVCAVCEAGQDTPVSRGYLMDLALSFETVPSALHRCVSSVRGQLYYRTGARWPQSP